jgi:hypothetical protein
LPLLPLSGYAGPANIPTVADANVCCRQALLLAKEGDNDNGHDNGIEYGLIDYFLLIHVGGMRSGGSSVGLPSPRRRMDRYRATSFLEHIDPDLLDKTTVGPMVAMAKDESIDGLFEMRRSWMSSLLVWD